MIQYVVVRGDLLKVLKWPVGALIAQACHACSAVIHLFHEDPNTVEYTKDLDRMHKVILEVRNPAQKFLKKSLIFHPLDSDYVLIFCWQSPSFTSLCDLSLSDYFVGSDAILLDKHVALKISSSQVLT